MTGSGARSLKEQAVLAFVFLDGVDALVWIDILQGFVDDLGKGVAPGDGAAVHSLELARAA